MRLHKRVLYAIGTVAVLLAAAAAVVHALVDPAKLRQVAQDKVRDAWGAELRVAGLELQFFPWPAVHATGVALASPQWAQAPNVIEVDQLDANLDLVPLFVGRVRVKSLDLAGVKAALEEADDGAQSWQPRGRGAAEGRQGEAGGDPLQIGEVHIRNVVIHRRIKRNDSEPLRIDDAWARLAPGLRDVTAEATLSRHGQPLTVKARFADLSRLGVAGAATEGHVELAFQETRATLDGRIPLERALRDHDVKIAVRSKSLDDVFAFLAFERGRTAAFSLDAASRGVEGGAELRGIALALGDLRMSGDLRVATGGGIHRITGRLAASRIDWLKVLAESGGAVKPPRRDEQIFHEDPVAWKPLAFLGGLHGQVDVAVDSLRLGNGLELQNLKSRATLGNGVVELAPFSAALLGGTGGGSLRFEAPKKSIEVRFEGDKLLLERWFAERRSAIPFRGGPMEIKANLAFAGDTFRELAASLSGPVKVRMGRGTWASPKAGEVEDMMVSALATKGSSDLDFQCISANLDFKRGRAEGRRVLGAKSDVSQLLTGGTVDFREERLDLRGRVQARKGITVGIATVAGGVQISGRLARPHIGMDPNEKPALLARAAAAVATAGATILGEALLTAAARDDPCEAVFK